MNKNTKQVAHEALDKLFAEFEKRGLPQDGIVDVTVQSITDLKDTGACTLNFITAEIIEDADGIGAAVEDIQMRRQVYDENGNLIDSSCDEVRD